MTQRVRDDECYADHEAALKCLDRNNYVRERCVDAFGAFQACRQRREEREAEQRRAVLRSDVLLGPLLRAWDRVAAGDEQETAAAPVEAAAASGTASSSSSAPGTPPEVEEWRAWRDERDRRQREEQEEQEQAAAEAAAAAATAAATQPGGSERRRWPWQGK